ncbi:kinesin light chain 4-like protein [Cinnamomum micranthum f. kanehirae]|uniref:Kinesin light chain 4-like protein n=1 Tax=Cinnamomum micranthum f. kanehirae TaxID=337451 RepID=A0A3S3NZ25_9MAGN|nr:kinesin light chain 4-like protein [Cinnamomum micranthum f. kanehirae]
MPGLVSVKTPPTAPPLRILVGGDGDGDGEIQNHREDPDSRNPKSSRSPLPKRTPSPSSSSRIKPSPDRNNSSSAKKKSTPEKQPKIDETALENPDLGPFLLKMARDTIASGESANKALDFAIRASKSFERCAGEGEPSLELAMSLHVVAAIYCSLGRLEEAVPELERAIGVPDVARGADHALAAFSGYMQLGDTHSMLGQLDRSIGCYEAGLKIQMEALGETDPRVAETCRYLAEANVQAMRFNEAENLCQKTLDIHREHSPPASLEEATDRRLMGLICEAKGEYELALEHLVLASMALIANGQENEVATVDVSIGDIYLSLGRFDEAVFSYQKALTVFKSTKGDNHPSVALVFIRLADLYFKTGKLRESKSYCESALRIYAKPVPATTSEEIASGLTEISAIYEAMNEPDEALRLLQKAMKLLEDAPGQRNTVAGIEAQMGVMFYMVGKFGEARTSFENAIAKLRASGERQSAFFGIVLNQMGLACVQLYKIDEAVLLFEEAREILEQEFGSCHPDTLGVYGNLAATYDATGRVEDAIEILEQVLRVREEQLGTANPDVDDEKRRLAELLKEVGRARNRKAKSLENLLDSSSQRTKKEGTRRWSSLGFKT